MNSPDALEFSRREFLVTGSAAVAATVVPIKAGAQMPAAEPTTVAKVSLQVNGQVHKLELDTRTTVLDMLREHLHFTGTKKGCDHGNAAPARCWSTDAASIPA
jgi:xanthine dehydrogenase YagT iron-sulfur-binding subunit